MVEQLAKKYEGSVELFSMNADESPEVPQKLKTQFIPLFVFYRDGVEVSRMVGPEEGELDQALSSMATAPKGAAAPAPVEAARAEPPPAASPEAPKRARKKVAKAGRAAKKKAPKRPTKGRRSAPKKARR